jgi:CHAT domain-containing protein
VGSPALTGDLASNLEPLEEATHEAREIAAKFDSPVLLSGSAASAERVEQELSRAAIFHFAGHALTVKNTPVLLLANAHDSQVTGILDADRVPVEKLRLLQLAVLSACSTAKDERNIAGPETLVKFFLRARVPHVIAARWSVDSNTTAAFMRAFYSTLLKEHSVPFSLQNARIELRSQPNAVHPYYWAAFEAFGR